MLVLIKDTAIALMLQYRGVLILYLVSMVVQNGPKAPGCSAGSRFSFNQQKTSTYTFGYCAFKAYICKFCILLVGCPLKRQHGRKHCLEFQSGVFLTISDFININIF